MKIVYTLAFWLVEVDLDPDEVSHGFHRLSFCIRHSALGLMLMQSTNVALQGLQYNTFFMLTLNTHAR